MQNGKSDIQVNYLVLAAGRGNRMQSDEPKVLMTLAGEPMVIHVLRTIAEADPKASVGVVVGYGRERVEKAINDRAPCYFPQLQLHFLFQEQLLGTGDAVRTALHSPWGKALPSSKSWTCILPGDQPLMTAHLIRQVAEIPGSEVVMRMVTCQPQEPAGYGRVIRRGKKGPVLRIVEDKDANAREKEINEVATSVYLFKTSFLRAGVEKLNTKNAQKEYYLTDLVLHAARSSKKIDVLQWKDNLDLKGVNNPWEWSEASAILNRRLVKHWAIQGVRFVDPGSVWLDLGVRLFKGVHVGPGVSLRGATSVEEGAVLDAHVVLENAKIGQQAHIKVGSVITASQVGSRCQIGPYAHLRPESHIGADSKIGNFVEIKKSNIGEKTSIAHLSYVGDAEVGNRVNIGCGFVTCNYDGRIKDGQRKHKTIIEDDVFVGSDCQTVAPVRLQKGSYVASGSTITKEVPTGALAIARTRQVNKENFVDRLMGRPRIDGREVCAE